MNKHEDRKCLDSQASLNSSFGFPIKKKSYSKAWDLNKVMVSFGKFQLGFPSSLFFSPWSAWGVGELRRFCHIGGTSFKREGSVFCRATERFHGHSHTQSLFQGKDQQGLNSHLCNSTYLYLSVLAEPRPRHTVHTPDKVLWQYPIHTSEVKGWVSDRNKECLHWIY